MDISLRDQVVFHLTGRRGAVASDDAIVAGMRPALLAPYRQLSSLRYDFPVILVAAADGGDAYARSLTQVVDAALRKSAPPGVAGEGTRRRALTVEREIRTRLARGATGTLLQLWDDAARALVGDDGAAARALREVHDALGVDGELADCDHDLPARFVRQAWSVVQREKAQVAGERIRRLVIRLEEILRADYLRSSRALEAPALQQSFGTAHHGLFDFEAMSGLLARAGKHGALDDRRQVRIERALAGLIAQRFFAPLTASAAGSTPAVHEFVFDSATEALAAFRRRLPEVAALLRALHVAELEVEGAYVDGMHDRIVDAIDEQSISATDLDFFPDYLVCLSAEAARADDTDHLAKALSSGLPLKVVAHVCDLLEESAVGQGYFAYGVRSTQLASVAMSIDGTFVLQTAASNLLCVRERVLRGLKHRGPALFSVYVPPPAGEQAMSSYLVAAAAMQSRAFPVFSFDPGAGPDIASRFSLENNPQPESDWPVEQLSYADPDLQSVTEQVTFTFADFAACDPRCARYFAPAPRAAWGESMVPAEQWLARPPQDSSEAVPYVLAVDDADMLCRLVVDERLMRASQRCREAWHRLQELGGIHDSRAERLLARERQVWEEQHRQDIAAAAPDGTAAAVAAVPVASAARKAEPEPEAARNPDEPYIETIRCSTCNECTTAFPRMFAYDENKQAYIKDLKAGTYRQMVEAAESCQVSVIHPGKPWNLQEPGLDELMERAKPFL
jgi:ferredoxin